MPLRFLSFVETLCHYATPRHYVCAAAITAAITTFHLLYMRGAVGAYMCGRVHSVYTYVYRYDIDDDEYHQSCIARARRARARQHITTRAMRTS